jgi:hypothetical protein
MDTAVVGPLSRELQVEGVIVFEQELISVSVVRAIRVYFALEKGTETTWESELMKFRRLAATMRQ